MDSPASFDQHPHLHYHSHPHHQHHPAAGISLAAISSSSSTVSSPPDPRTPPTDNLHFANLPFMDDGSYGHPPPLAHQHQQQHPWAQGQMPPSPASFPLHPVSAPSPPQEHYVGSNASSYVDNASYDGPMGYAPAPYEQQQQLEYASDQQQQSYEGGSYTMGSPPIPEPVPIPRHGSFSSISIASSYDEGPPPLEHADGYWQAGHPLVYENSNSNNNDAMYSINSPTTEESVERYQLHPVSELSVPTSHHGHGHQTQPNSLEPSPDMAPVQLAGGWNGGASVSGGTPSPPPITMGGQHAAQTQNQAQSAPTPPPFAYHGYDAPSPPESYVEHGHAHVLAKHPSLPHLRGGIPLPQQQYLPPSTTEGSSRYHRSNSLPGPSLDYPPPPQHPYRPSYSGYRYELPPHLAHATPAVPPPPPPPSSKSKRSPPAWATQPPTGPVIHTDDAASKETPNLRRKCYNCGTTEPPSWRRSTLTPGKIVCNRCGLYERTHLKPRPSGSGGELRKTSNMVVQQQHHQQQMMQANRPYPTKVVVQKRPLVVPPPILGGKTTVQRLEEERMGGGPVLVYPPPTGVYYHHQQHQYQHQQYQHHPQVVQVPVAAAPQVQPQALGM